MNFFKKKIKDEKDGEKKKSKDKKLLEREINSKKVNKLIRFNYLKIIRIVLWALIVLIIIRGVVSIIKPNDTQNIISENKKFLEKVENENSLQLRLFSFAEDFTRDYFTRYPINKDDFKNRILKYTTEQLAIDMNNSSYSEIINVSAFYFEKYSDNQYNISVSARIKQFVPKEGQENVQEDKKAYDNNIITENIKVPIYVDEQGKMMVDSIPMLIAAAEKSNIKIEEFNAEGESNQEIVKKINDGLNEFFKVYYGGEQTQLDFLLEKEGIIKVTSSQSKFEKINTTKIYKISENEHLVIADINLKSFNNDIKQKVNLTIVKNGDKYLVKQLDTRVSNLNIKK